MQLRRFLLLCCLFLNLSTYAYERAASEQVMSENLVSFIKFNDTLQSESDINRLSALTTDDFQYYQPSFNIHLSKEQWLMALKERLSAKQTRSVKTDIVQTEFALNVAFVRQSSRWEQQINGKWYARSSDNLTTLFEFSNGKISAVREYW